MCPEEFVVAKLLSDRRCFYEILQGVSPTDFKDAFLRNLFQRGVKGYQEDNVPSITDLILEHPQESDRLWRLLDIAASTMSLQYHLEGVRRGAVMRRLLDRITDVRAKIAGADPLDKVPLEAWLREIQEAVGVQDLIKPPKQARIIMEQVFSEIENPQLSFVSTGYRNLDWALGGMGLRREDVWGIAARTGQGKSMLALNIAVRSALKGHRVLFATIEMDAKSLIHRAMADLASVEGQKIRAGLSKGKGFGLESRDCDKLSKLYDAKYQPALENLYISDETTAIKDIEQIVRYERSHRPFDLVVIDYLQLFQVGDGKRYQSAFERVSAVSTIIKAEVAKKHKAAVISCLQVNREGSKLRPEEIDAFHIRDSNQVNQDCDFLSVLYHPEQGEYLEQKEAVLRFDKKRHGQNGGLCYFNVVGKYLRFEETDVSHRV